MPSIDYRLIADNTHDWETLIGPDGSFLYCSPSSEWTTGYPPQAFLDDGTFLERIIHPADRELYTKHRHEAVQRERPERIEFRIIRPNGEEVWIEHLCRPVFDGERRYLGARSSNRDITERKRLEQDLSEHAVIDETLRFLIHCGDPNSDEPFFPALARFLAKRIEMEYICIDHLEGDGLTAHTLAVWFDGHFEDNISYTLKDTPCGDVVGNHICCFPSGVRHLFPKDIVLQEMVAESYVGVTLFNAQGKPIGLIAAIGRRPLSNRPLAEAVIRLAGIRAAGELERTLAEQQFHTLFNEMLDGFALHEIICDESGQPVDYRFLEANPAFARLTGLDLDTLRGRRVREVLPEIEPFWIETYGRVALTAQPAFFEHCAAQLERCYEVKAFSPTKGQFAVLFADITERKRSQQQLAEQMDELRRWQEVTLGREMRILELKEEVNELLARLGEPPRFESAAGGERGEVSG